MAASVPLAVGLTVSRTAAMATAASPASAAPVGHSAGAHDPTLTILTGGDRTSSVPGSTPPTDSTAGSVDGVAGVEYEATGPDPSTAVAGRCTSTVTSCEIEGLKEGDTYTVHQVKAPASNTPSQLDYFLNPVLGVGAATPAGSVATTNYATFTVTMTGDQTVPVASSGDAYGAGGTNLDARTNRWAVSRYNPAPPASCARSVAILFDLSASISATDLGHYKTAAETFVRAMLGTDTRVTLYTFATTAPAASSSGSNNGTFGPESTLTSAGVNSLVARIMGLSLVPSPTTQGFTNWDQGMWQMTTTARGAASQAYDEAIVLTDGDPTVHSVNGAPDNAT